ncbi:hypothetical protein UFOVP124_10 [uncultured Caudovirales phage]|uniref:Uncharacterized protein n=1 Tax=uncultured Caudovirales phage TaxID=2100421 RepID=A0A6J5LB67_9CAUD|nr:hypothetical protein UFOVP124_10 [uncultured Caudovirales phage]
MYGVNRYGVVKDAGTANKARPLRIHPAAIGFHASLAVRDVAMQTLHSQGWPQERIAVAFSLSQKQVSIRLAAIRRNIKALA